MGATDLCHWEHQLWFLGRQRRVGKRGPTAFSACRSRFRIPQAGLRKWEILRTTVFLTWSALETRRSSGLKHHPDVRYWGVVITKNKGLFFSHLQSQVRNHFSRPTQQVIVLTRDTQPSTSMCACNEQIWAPPFSSLTVVQQTNEAPDLSSSPLGQPLYLSLMKLSI